MVKGEQPAQVKAAARHQKRMFPFFNFHTINITQVRVKYKSYLTRCCFLKPSRSITHPFYFYHEGHEGREKVIVRQIRKNGADQRSLPLVCASAHIALVTLWSSFPREISTFNIQCPGSDSRSAWRYTNFHLFKSPCAVSCMPIEIELREPGAYFVSVQSI